YAESEPRDAHALLLSPWPESIYSYEPTWTRLAEHMHLVAIDLPGFGRSERRDSLMSPKAMGEVVVRVADAFGLEQPHAGGPRGGTRPRRFPPPRCIRAVPAAGWPAPAPPQPRSSPAGG